jgi:hypothetical protein
VLQTVAFGQLTKIKEDVPTTNYHDVAKTVGLTDVPMG